MTSWTIVGPTYPYKGGIAQHTTDLAHRLSERGDHAIIETWRRQYPKRLYPGVQELDEPERTPYPSVRRRLAWNRPDTWHRAGTSAGRDSDTVCIALVSPVQFPAYETLARAARRHGARVIAIAHNVLPHESTRADRLLAQRLYRLVDGMMVHSSAEADRARELGVSSVVERPLPFFFECATDPCAPVGPPKGQLAFVGFVRPYKGLDVLIRALAETTSRPRLVVVGEFWDDVEQYESIARDLAVDDLCTFRAGYASDVDLALVIDESDALVVPYRSATGTQHPRIGRSRCRPCIVTDVGDMASQIIDGTDGFVVRPGDPSALATAIDRLYEPGTIESLARTIRPVEPRHEWADYLEGLDELATRARQDRSAPPRRSTFDRL